MTDDKNHSPFPYIADDKIELPLFVVPVDRPYLTDLFPYLADDTPYLADIFPYIADDKNR